MPIAPFGAKAARFITRPVEEDAKLNILNGAVRSSKTWAINARWLSLLSSGWWPGGIGLVTGMSKTSIKTNVLNDLFEWVGEKRYTYNSQSGELKLMGRPFLVCGAKDEASYKIIRGSTVGLWIADEMTLYPKSFFEMAMTRMSLRGSRGYGSTNPADPYHYLKEWMDDPDKIANGDVWSETWTLRDNPNIDPVEKARLERSFVGVFKLRNIDGLWVIASGAIYRDCLTEENWYTDATRPMGLLSRGGHAERFVAIDAGTLNPCVFVDGIDDGKTVWIDREMYFDGRAQMKQKTDTEYADDLIIFANGGNPLNPIDRLTPAFRQTEEKRMWPGIIVDPSAASLKTALRQRGFHTVDADNSVDDGISLTAAMLNLKKLKINKERCPNSVREMQTYAWDLKRGENGKEQPIKKHDHTCDAIRYRVKTRISPYRLAA